MTILMVLQSKHHKYVNMFNSLLYTSFIEQVYATLSFIQVLTQGPCSMCFFIKGSMAWRPLIWNGWKHGMRKAMLWFLSIVLLRSFVYRSCWSQEWYKTSCLLEATFSCWNCSASVPTISFRFVYGLFLPWKHA